MIRLTSFMNESPIYVPTGVVIKENYEYEFGMNHVLPTSKYKPLGGAMVVYDGIEYAVKESQEEVARKVLEWQLLMERYRIAGAEIIKQKDAQWLFDDTEVRLKRIAGLEEQA